MKQIELLTPSPRKALPSVQLLHGDCLKVMPTLPAQSVQFVFADFPYGSSHTQCAWDCPFDLHEFWKQQRHTCVPTAIVCATSVQPFTTSLVQTAPKLFRYTMVWDKKFSGSFSQAKYRPMRTHEDICVFWRDRGVYNPQMTLRDKPIKQGCSKLKSKSAPIAIADCAAPKKIYTHKHPVSVLAFSNRADKRGMHPTQKPVALLEWLIKTYTNPGDTVLDPVMGSASTGVACLRTGRNFIGIEKDATYFKVASDRIAAEQARLQGAP